MTILLHSSKTMRPQSKIFNKLRMPKLIEKTIILDKYLKNISTEIISEKMNVSYKLAIKTKETINSWNYKSGYERCVSDIFLGDIYSGLQSYNWNNDDLKFADKYLYILSGFYGLLSPLDGILPYRLELAYKLVPQPFKDLYEFWGDSIFKQLPKDEILINLSSIEYSKVILPFYNPNKVITPVFLTYNKHKKEPVFVVVHSKITRGAYANWMIKNRIEKVKELNNFNDLGYKYDKNLSTINQPVFICNIFNGFGLSIRLK